ncbi:MAG: asparagine synthase (glutamine-hydrolysing) [Candidatus Peregrinibacteria bacterium Gr01-1014_25]|nr:MAG: asparagine synthase (glutamine-hydrolysing) [Candidatus Peregrinibacteria bacterium Gr01-1014_25]
MCGIAGFAGEDRGTIERMTDAIRHRGPDGVGIDVEQGASLGHRRLAILDPRPEGNQPMWNENRSVAILLNGEIFNYRELREREGFACRTGTDTEVLLKLYERHGMSFLPRLRGMFALAIYDARSRTWHLARDTSGIKPLYRTTIDGRLHFASEVRSLLRAFPSKPQLNLRSLSLYVRLQYVPGPETLCEGIESVVPGSAVEWHEGREHVTHFTPDVAPTAFPSPGAFREGFPALMDDAVREHLVSDKPVGLFLSGGMDSTIVLHHMARHMPSGLNTFTMRFEATREEDADRFNADAKLAALSAAHYRTTHHEVHMTAQDCRAIYRDTARALDLPNADSVAMAQALLSRTAKKHVDVILTGAGGDELFGGYPRYRIARLLHASRAIPASVRAALAHLAGVPADICRLAPDARLATRLLARPPREGRAITKDSWFDPDATDALSADWYDRLHQSDPVRALMEFDRHVWLVDESLKLTDATTMSSGLEGRVPFLDVRVVASALAMPTSWHVGWRTTKRLLKETYFPVLPPHIRALHKACFFPPMAKWIRREAAPLVEEALASPRIRELFDVDALRTVFDKHVRHEAYGYHTLATITQLAFWFEEVYDAH